MTGIGPVAVRQPRVRDREAAAADPDRIRFSPSILPPYMRRSKSIETLLPILYLKGISTGDFSEALAALLGKDAAGLSASAIGRLKDGWLDEHTAWQKRDLSAKRYVYIWADGIHLQARLEDEKQCILVLIGATPEGRKELVGFTDGARESAQDWRDLLLDLKRRGLDVSPRLVIADGALGFWKAAGEVWPRKRASSAAGCTRPRTCSPSCRRASSRARKSRPAVRARDARCARLRAHLRFEAADVAAVNLNLVHPLTGPVYIEGAKRGDALAVTVVDIAPDDFGYTTIVPGFGFLRDVFRDPFIVHWELNRLEARSKDLPGIAVPNERIHGNGRCAAGQAGNRQMAEAREGAGRCGRCRIDPATR